MCNVADRSAVQRSQLLAKVGAWPMKVKTQLRCGVLGSPLL
jgi:hypothetical protein